MFNFDAIEIDLNSVTFLDSSNIIVVNSRSNTHTWKISEWKEQKVKIRNHPEVDMIIHCSKLTQYLQGLCFFMFRITYTHIAVSIFMPTKRISAHMRWKEKYNFNHTDNLIRPSSYVKLFCAYSYSPIDISHKTFHTK